MVRNMSLPSSSHHSEGDDSSTTIRILLGRKHSHHHHDGKGQIVFPEDEARGLPSKITYSCCSSIPSYKRRGSIGARLFGLGRKSKACNCDCCRKNIEFSSSPHPDAFDQDLAKLLQTAYIQQAGGTSLSTPVISKAA
jgi:hypothetical protein